MSKLTKKLKQAFSLMELSICILIVSIIVIVCIPVVIDQMKKTDEYSYFMAFKTVEKMGSQIVAFGDPDEGDSVAYSDYDAPLSIKDRIALFTHNLSGKFFQKAIASNTVIVSFPSYEYDMARLCNGNTKVMKDFQANAGYYYEFKDFLPEGASEAEIDAWRQANCNIPIYNSNERLKLRFNCRNTTTNVKDYFATTEDTALEYCNKVKTDCQNLYPTYNIESEYKIVTLTQAEGMPDYGICNVYINGDFSITPNIGEQNGVGTLPSFLPVTCNAAGYINMAGSLLNTCNCDGANPIVAANNPSVCCPAPAAGNVAYALSDNSSCVPNGCLYGAFDEGNQRCCPANSFYSRTLGHCFCAQGYTPNNGEDGNLVSCTLIEPIECPLGYHLDEDANVCVINAPITKASRFCELIGDNYNVTSLNCNTFDDVVAGGAGVDPVSYNQDLYNAITANDTAYLSSQAVEGAFNNIDPNVVFSNGLKMWILGDKVASIAGLSFNPVGYTPEINACVDKRVYTQAQCDALGENHYFCRGSNHCFYINPGDSAARLQDARNCCPTVDLEDLRRSFAGNTYLRDSRAYAINGFTVFVDINGDKDSDQGGGTLWKDVFPFYISANGQTYPAYPLNAQKTDISLYQGGNSSALATDVYYYDIIDGQRRKQMAYSAIPYARAQCFALQVSAFTPYCQNLGSKFRNGNLYERMDQYIYSDNNPCWNHRCYLHVKNKIKFL